MALLACHTLRHSFNVAEHKRLKQQRQTLGLFATGGTPHGTRVQVCSLCLCRQLCEEASVSLKIFYHSEQHNTITANIAPTPSLSVPPAACICSPHHASTH